MKGSKRHKPISEDTTNMEAENQDRAFVNKTLDKAEQKNLIKGPYKK